MPDKVDLEPLRSHGLLATELSMPETVQIKGAGADKPVPNAEQVCFITVKSVVLVWSACSLILCTFGSRIIMVAL